MALGLSVLIAEDDQNDAFILQRAFNACGVTRPLHIVRDGVDAIKYLPLSTTVCSTHSRIF